MDDSQLIPPIIPIVFICASMVYTAFQTKFTAA
jgi:hypothetical protein